MWWFLSAWRVVGDATADVVEVMLSLGDCIPRFFSVSLTDFFGADDLAGQQDSWVNPHLTRRSTLVCVPQKSPFLYFVCRRAIMAMSLNCSWMKMSGQGKLSLVSKVGRLSQSSPFPSFVLARRSFSLPDGGDTITPHE